MSNLINLKLSELGLSPENMRKTATKKKSDSSLKASIKTLGIIQNLVVSPKDSTGKYLVEAGGRRFAQCLSLVGDGHYSLDTTVPVRIVDVEKGEKAKALSLSENYHREATNPVDDFEAFTYLSDVDGLSVTDISKQFGVTKRFVEQRLSLGTVAPRLLELARAGKLELELLEAFSISKDHPKQIEIYELLKNDQFRFNSNNIRTYLTDEATSDNNKLVKYVTLKAYKKAGGIVITDLFGDNSYLADQELFDSMLNEKIGLEVSELEKVWKWVDVEFKLQSWEVSEYSTIGREFKKKPKALLTNLKVKQERLDELDNMDRDGEDWSDKLHKEWVDIDDVIESIETEIESYKIPQKNEMAFAGCVVTINDDGGLVVHPGLVRDEDFEALEVFRNPDRAKPKSDESDVEMTEENEPMYSQALLQDLSAYKKSLMKAALIENTSLSSDLAMFSICVEVFVSGWGKNPLDLTVKDTKEESSKKDIADSKAQKMLDDNLATLDRSWVVDNTVESLKLFRALSNKSKKELMAYCASISLGSCYSDNDALNNYILNETGFVESDYFRPEESNFFKRLKGSSFEGVKRELLGDEFVNANINKKASFFTPILSGAVNGEVPQGSPLTKEELCQWMPKGF